MDIDLLKQRLQAHFTDGLVTIIGSGHSAAYGVPGMAKLAEVLLSELAPGTEDKDDWTTVAKALGEGVDLETALDELSSDSPLIPAIVEATAAAILGAELEAIDEIVSGRRRLALAELIPFLAVDGSSSIITTNYDRIAEVAVEMAGFGLDCTFMGEHVGRFGVDAARQALRSNALKQKSGVRFVYRRHIRIRKPHGSLDWYLREGHPIRCPYGLALPRLMITPGAAKYLRGYEQPFDKHRELANQDIDRAARFLTIGYGFNDPHLQTHLEPRIQAGVPAVILARTLTAAARKLVAEAGVIAVERVDDTSSCIHIDGMSLELPVPNLWSLDSLIDEVLT
jgi:hypothetical protein